VSHGMMVNAQALMTMSHQRLCYKAAKETVGVWTKLRKAMELVDPDLVDFMVPKCVYRGGYCPEFSECSVGLKAVVDTYRK